MPVEAVIIVLAVVAVIAIAAAVWFFLRSRRTEQLREGFGPEYDRTVQETGSRGAAEKELAARRKRVEQLQIRELAPEERRHFADAWRSTQAHFVDDPGAAIGEADDLVGRLMHTRGYPVGDFEQRAADVSVDHPHVVTNYRSAHAIARRHADGGVSTEDLRQAMVHYRELFTELLETDDVPASVAHTPASDQHQHQRREVGQ
jgi:hypothetical protein